MTRARAVGETSGLSGQAKLGGTIHSSVLSRAERLTPLPDNVLSLAVARGWWNGIRVDVAESHGRGTVAHHLCYETETRLTVLLEETGSPCEPRLKQNERCSIAYTARNMQFVPAGMDIWGFSANMGFVKDATLSFDLKQLSKRLKAHFPRDVVLAPRLRFSDDRTWTLVRLLAESVNDPDPSAQLYGDGLTAAIVSRLFATRQAHDTARRGLAPWQLRRVLEYLATHLPERVELEQLAGLVDLSQSHFSRAFKSSTGMAPYQWQLNARIRRAQSHLLNTDASLERVAEATGFADGVHFGRTFRRLVGATPAAWRREQRR